LVGHGLIVAAGPDKLKHVLPDAGRDDRTASRLRRDFLLAREVGLGGADTELNAFD
jgi:hypothetical protein